MTDDDTRQAWTEVVHQGNADCLALICIHETEGHTRRIRADAPSAFYHGEDGTLWGPCHSDCLDADKAAMAKLGRPSRFLRLP